MKNLLLRQELINRHIRLYELAFSIGIADATLSRWLRHEWPESLQKKAISLLDEVDDNYRKSVKSEIAHFVSAQNPSYASRIMREVSELELRREKEREEWY